MKRSKCIFLNGLIDLAQSRLGTKVVYKTDEFFAPAKRIINPWPPVFKEGVFDKHGKWMDGWETRRKRDERRHPLLLPEECVAEEFEVGERVWSASYDAPAQVGGRLDDSMYVEKYGSPCYSVYVFEKVDTSNSWFPGVEVGGFNAYCLAYDLGKLSHLEEAGVDLQRI